MNEVEDELIFLPLGGAGEIGMNLNLYGADGKWLMVDCGVTFADDHLPGIDLLTADPSFIADRAKDLVALALTHAHEDHLGAVAHLWPRLRCPIYATPFTAAMLRRKLAEVGLEGRVPVTIVEYGKAYQLGPFNTTWIGITHSIPEGSALAIRTRQGLILHSGDWKLDPEPLLGKATDADLFRAVGDEGVLALICDSTNVFNPGTSGSEAAVRDSLMKLVANRSGRVMVTTFASHVSRLSTLAKVAAAHGREVALVGRSMWRAVEAAREAGYLKDLPKLLTDEEAAWIPRDKLLIIAAGAQGEGRGALARITFGDNQNVKLSPGDLVIFSSKIIPGNDKQVGRIINRLVTDGIEVLTERHAFVHVSGHPARDELRQLYEWLRPRIAIPVHGEAMHLQEHVKLAKSLGVPETVLVENGKVVRLAPGPAAIVDHVPVGRLALEGKTLIPTDSDVIRARRRMRDGGTVTVTVVIDDDGALVEDPRVLTLGLGNEDDKEAFAELRDTVRRDVERMGAKSLRDTSGVELTIRRGVNRVVRDGWGKRPLVEVQVISLPGRLTSSLAPPAARGGRRR